MSSRRNVSSKSSGDDGFTVATTKTKGGARGRGGMQTVVRRGGRDLSALSDEHVDQQSSQFVAEDVEEFQEKLTIPQGAAAFVIGRGGVNAKRIREMGCRLTVKDTVVVMQSGSRQVVQQAKKIV
jgi:KH domain